MKNYSLYKNRRTEKKMPYVPVRYRAIYEIKCILNGRTYIGQTGDLTTRWNQHICGGLAPLSFAHLTNPFFIRDVQAYGIENFTFRILKRCFSMTDAEREALEQELIKARQPFYNIEGK